MKDKVLIIIFMLAIVISNMFMWNKLKSELWMELHALNIEYHNIYSIMHESSDFNIIQK